MTLAGCLLLADIVALFVVPTIGSGAVSTSAIIAAGLALAGARLGARTRHDDGSDDHQN